MRVYRKECFDESHEVGYIPQWIWPRSSGIIASGDVGKDSLSKLPASLHHLSHPHGNQPNKC